MGAGAGAECGDSGHYQCVHVGLLVSRCLAGSELPAGVVGGECGQAGSLPGRVLAGGSGQYELEGGVCAGEEGWGVEGAGGAQG